MLIKVDMYAFARLASFRIGVGLSARALVSIPEIKPAIVVLYMQVVVDERFPGGFSLVSCKAAQPPREHVGVALFSRSVRPYQEMNKTQQVGAPVPISVGNPGVIAAANVCSVLTSGNDKGATKTKKKQHGHVS